MENQATNPFGVENFGAESEVFCDAGCASN